MVKHKKIVMLTSGGESTMFMYNGIKTEHEISSIIVENESDRKTIIKGRIKRLGFVTVFGQILFRIFCVSILTYVSKNRIQSIVSRYNLDKTPLEKRKIVNVSSVNSEACRNTLKRINPDLIIVNGTRIISKKTLDCVNATFINTHVGITPKYRGVHGGYWSLVNDDKENCGVTVHLVDAGIDTGSIVYQANIHPTKNDNFSTYPYLQIGEGITLMRKAINNFNNDILKTQVSRTSESVLWYHPTIWSYVYNRIFKGIK